MKYIGQYSSPEDIATLDNVRSVEILATDASDLADSAKNALAEHVDDTNIHVTLAEKTTWNGKQDKITGAATTITDDNLTANRALVSNSSGKVAVSAVTSTELGYLDGVTSNVQTQLNSKQPKITVNGIIQGDGAGNLSVAELNPASVGLGNVDNVKQYSATNPPPYPVTSVNGATGEVKSTFYVTVTQGDDNSVTADKTAAEVYAAYAAGYAVYAVAFFYAVDVVLELPLVSAAPFFETFLLSFGALCSLKQTAKPQYLTVAYNGTNWFAWLGTLAKESDIPTKLKNPYSLNIKIGDTTTRYDGSAVKTVEIPKGVPSVTTADNGKFLRVVNGAWTAAAIADANGGSF